LAILAASVFLTSCEQENIVSPISETPLLQGDLQNSSYYVLPVGIDSKNTIVTYLESVDEETTRKLEKSYKISEFLKMEGKFEEVWKDMVKGQHLSDTELSNYLSNSQISRLETYEPIPIIESRGCWWEYWGSSQYNGSWCTYTWAYVCGGSSNGVPYSGIPTVYTYENPC